MFYIVIAFILLYSIILHEIAHGKAAELMGDPTARMYGRMTLNPLPHIDPIGTILPIFLILIGSPIVFGWAKPVPINPYNFHDYKKGMVWTSVAGILTNLFVAWILVTVLKLMPAATNNFTYALQTALMYGVRINIVLAIFNLIPVPPLDGSKLFQMILPYPYSEYIRRIEPYGFFILIFILMFPPTEELLRGIISFVYNLMMIKFF
ncbi:site-2 protease family protein [Candidatus Saganbacteria bacterium CG08_land_8_20_14_0_20_45_16]|uniref:Site-2 protease family protein n=1 Tax=Candidatus Saganbacteria bacterium CG08_land_8_20_14_0_20_45_16 TaxID=2014293 RepID=A0A2H0XTW4_UNCSA|nr:MAG: site-2 protease family protein [Candidatus Saganbacteria bacterium CG08_land_8_20_14_0_20_45_16]